MAQDAWDELNKIDKSQKIDVVALWKVQVEVARALGKWELSGGTGASAVKGGARLITPCLQPRPSSARDRGP